jgi:hypothetical protein
MDGYISEATKLSGSRDNYVKGRVNSLARNADVQVEALFNGVGAALKAYGDGTHCTVTQDECYTARIHPTIRYVS